MANFGARDVANNAAALGLFEADGEIRAALGQIGLFALELHKAHEAGDSDRVAALIEGVDLAAEAEEALAQPGARERAQEIQERIVAEAIADVFGGAR